MRVAGMIFISPCNQPTKITLHAYQVQPGPRMLLFMEVVQTASMPRQLRLDGIACRFDPPLHTRSSPQPGDRVLQLRIEKCPSISSAFRSFEKADERDNG
jgi:hypothetical protein